MSKQLLGPVKPPTSFGAVTVESEAISTDDLTKQTHWTAQTTEEIPHPAIT